MHFSPARISIITFLFLAPISQAWAEKPLTVTVTRGSIIFPDTQIEAEEEKRRVPGASSIIDSRQWNGKRASTIKDITDYEPSVFAQPRNGAEASRISIRGSGLANAFQGRGLLIMQDGIPINKADGEFEFQTIDPWLVNYVQVFPGANGVEYGASNFGGALNLITPTSETQDGYALNTEVGSFGHQHGLLSAGKEIGNAEVYAGGTYFSQDGYRAQNQQKSLRFQGNIGIKSSDSMYHRFYVGQTKTQAEIPGAISRAEINTDSRQANPLNKVRDYERNLDVTRLAYKNVWKDDGATLENIAFWSHRDLDNPVTTYIISQTHDVGLRTKYTKDFGLNRVTLGYNIYYGNGSEERFRNTTGEKGARVVNRDSNAMTSEAYSQYDKHLFGQLYGIASLQASYAERHLEESFPVAQEQTEEYAGYNPRIGFRYDLDANTQIFTNLSRSFEPPTLSELSGGNAPGFAQLEAQKATTAEIGMRSMWRGISWQASYYHGWLEDEFVNYRFDDGSTATINADKTKRDGIELGFAGTALDDLALRGDNVSVRASYKWSHFTLNDDPLYGNNILPGVPEHYARAEMLYHHPSGFYAGPNIEWTPEAYPVDLTNSVNAPGYTLYGLSAGWTSQTKAVGFYLEGRNLLDRNYIATTNVIPDAAGADGRYYFPGEGRALYAGMTLRF